MKYKIDHKIFNEIEFTSDEVAQRAAERLADYVLRNSDRSEIVIDILRWIEDKNEDPRAPAWFHHETVEMRIGTNLREYYD